MQFRRDWHAFIQLAAALSCLIGCRSVAMAQLPRPGLKIVVVDGEGAINNSRLGSARDPVVEVRDENDKPLSGARVTFSLPESGPGGSFFGAGTNLNVTTDATGRATGFRFRQNQAEGRFQIRVSAVYEERTAAVIITQSNVNSADNINPAAKPTGKFGRTKLIALLTGGVIIGAVVAARDGDSTTTSPGTTITPGTIFVGTPR